MESIALDLRFPLINRAYNEAVIAYKFIYHNIPPTIIPATIFTIASALDAKLSFPFLLQATVFSFIHFFLYIYAFDLCSQVDAIEEDRLNKPNRPLPSGLVTVQGVKVRLVVITIAFLTCGLFLNVLIPDIIWVISYVVHAKTPFGKSWVDKNLNMAIGTWAMMAAAWQIGGGNPLIGAIWTIPTAFLVLPLVTIQDLRDVEGDLAVKRHTLPIVLGDSAIRKLIFVMFLVAPAVAHITMFQPLGLSPIRFATEVIVAIPLIVVAIRTITLRNAKADNLTYYIFTVWYILQLAAAVVYAVSPA